MNFLMHHIGSCILRSMEGQKSLRFY